MGHTPAADDEHKPVEAVAYSTNRDLPEVGVEATNAELEDLPEVLMEAVVTRSRPETEVDTRPIVTTETRPAPSPGRADPLRFSPTPRVPDGGALPARLADRSGTPTTGDEEPADDCDDSVTSTRLDPAAPVIVAPPGGSTSRSRSITLMGTADPDSRLLVRDWTMIVGESKAAADGEWSLTLRGLRDGAHMYTVDAVGVTGSITSTCRSCLVTVELPKSSAVLEALRSWVPLQTGDRASRRIVATIAFLASVAVVAAVLFLLVAGRSFHL